MNPIKLYEENKVIAGFSLLNLLFKQNRGGLVKVVMDKLLDLYNNKKIKPVVDSLWALEEVGARIYFYLLRFLFVCLFCFYVCAFLDAKLVLNLCSQISLVNISGVPSALCNILQNTKKM